ncbi:putative serine/threonine-protein kinase haspin homolog isoform X2 [Drosophila navojoa]|uniref:putative serine/threonine-protein kinase haspin homolog isoform X2 n=1 Tax=Drosophila navojoa TaxID=7232 RepID=UPI0011BE76AD|nr:putative serine/threonine-protein kinase haspin homolog isoform X2 [Drosophila navojoa]
MDQTFPDDAWKDSFDRLLDPLPHLRELNLIKKNVRKSFNLDSSVENSNPNILSIDNCFLRSTRNNHTNADDKLSITNKFGNSISTPFAKRFPDNLFDCALSPIGGMKLDGFLPKDLGKHGQQRKSKQVNFRVNTVSPETSIDSFSMSQSVPTLNAHQISRRQTRSSLVLLPGKWRKSLRTWCRTNHNEISGRTSSKQCLKPPDVKSDDLRVVRRNSRKSQHINRVSEYDLQICYEKEVLNYCGQTKPLKFSVAYAAAKMLNTCKIGEGVYGEVFKYTPKNKTVSNVVLKVLPIEGSSLVNEEVQKTFEQILPEIIISKEMSALRTNQTTSTSGFVDLYNVKLVKGKYPKHLIRLWEDYDEKKESENDNPTMYTDNQLFIVLELKFAGTDMSTFGFQNAEQGYFALQQVTLTLAVGEEAFQFEHRDLHWGNILIEKTKNKFIDFKLGGKHISVATKGIQTTIIDYTLSRVTVSDCCHYNDLSQDDDLFAATGDYQYDIYRMMRDELKNNWSSYSPKTNVQWLSYVNSKLIDGVKYKSINTNVHKTYLRKLKAFNNIVLNFNSAGECGQYLCNMN